jgi:hypothetical protein
MRQMTRKFEPKPVADLKSPPAKLVRFFQESRDGWKKKHHDVKGKLVHLEHQVRAVERSREAWAERAKASEERAVAAESEAAALRLALDAESKKKFSR